jgi:hypothetical protein
MVIAEADAHAPALPLIALPRECLIVHGELLTPHDARPAGVALALQAPTRDAVDALLGLDQHLDVRVLDWEFGGRR